jgi:cation transport ATPase
MKTRHLFITLAFSLITIFSRAQFVTAELGVNGLTCSACTRSVEMSIRKLDFVKDVQMNLDNTNGIITFKPGSDVSIEKLAKAVIDAGFSVRYLQATFKTDSVLHISNDYCFVYNNASYQFVNITQSQTNNEIVMKFIGKEYQETKEYKKLKANLKPMCTGMKNTYYVTL